MLFVDRCLSGPIYTCTLLVTSSKMTFLTRNPRDVKCKELGIISVYYTEWKPVRQNYNV